MVKIALQIKAQLENVTDLQTQGTDFRWYLKLECSSCREASPEFVYVTQEENQPLKGGRGHASIVLKCKLCSRANSLDIMEQSLCAYTANDVPSFKTIAVFDCRGVEPIKFDPRSGWTATGTESGTTFSDIDLSTLEWADYDEKAQESVGVYELEHKFMRI